jgi:hypothetical protein
MHYVGALLGFVCTAVFLKYKTKVLSFFLNFLIKTPTLFLTPTSAKIEYIYMGQKYYIYLPYNRRNMIKMKDFKAELISETGTVVDITHQPGFPYLISAKDLGGKYIKLSNLDNGMEHIYEDNVCPLFCTEVTD